MAEPRNPSASAVVEAAIGPERAHEFFGELASAAVGLPDSGQIFLTGLLPFLSAFGAERWLAESRTILSELKPLLSLMVAETIAPRPTMKKRENTFRPIDLVGYSTYGLFDIERAISETAVAPTEAVFVSPYDGSRIVAAELEGNLDAFLRVRGPGKHRAVFLLYAAALVKAKGAAFAASVIAAEPKPDEASALWFATAFRALSLYLHEKQGADIALAAAIIRDAFPRNGFGHREAVLVLSDFLVDERYTAESIDPLLAFTRSCAILLHPARTAAFASVLRLAKDFIRQSKSTDERIVGIILKTFLEHPHLDLAEWVGEGARVVRKTGNSSKETRAFFDRSSEDSRRVWDSIDVGIAFERVEPRLRPFVSALSERAIALSASPSKDGQRHCFMTDGQTIYVPAYAMYVKNRDDNYLMVRHGAAHECAHIEYGSFAIDERRYRQSVAALDRIFPGAWERNVALTKSFRQRVARELEARGYRVKSTRSSWPDDYPPITRLYFRSPFPMLFRDLFNIVEDRRVNAHLYSKYPGFRAEKRRVDELDLGELPELEELSEETRFLQAFIERLWFGQVKGRPRDEDEGIIDALVGLVESGDPFQTDAYDAAVTAGEALRLAIAHLGGSYPAAFAKLRATENKLDVSFSLFGVRGRGRNGLLDFELVAARGRMGDEGPDEAAKREEASATFGNALKANAQVDIADHLAGRPTFRYPEWQESRLAYDRDACLLAEFSPESRVEDLADGGLALSDYLAPRNKEAAGKALRLREAPVAEAIRRAFAAMKDNLDVIERGAEDGEDIDFDRAVDCFMDFGAGNRVDMDFYLKRTRRARDVLCSLVLDMSPSTSEKVGQLSIFEHERAAAYLMAEAMAAIGDRFGIFSYYDYGAKANIFHIVKDFDAPYDSAVVDSLAALKNARGGFSRIAPGMRHILAKMRDREARTKIVFLITDGQPVYLQSISSNDKNKTATTYSIDGRTMHSDVPVKVRSLEVASDRHAYADIAKVAEEARLAGVRLFCVTLDKESVASLSKIFGDSLIYLDNAAALPARLVEIFRRMTR